MDLLPGLVTIVCSRDPRRARPIAIKDKVRRTSAQIFAIVVFALALYFAWDFGQRVVTSIRLDQSAEEAQIAVDHAVATQTALVEKKQLVESAPYVETVVRGWHWAKTGEIVVIPQITPAATPAITVPQPTPSPAPVWQQIVDFLFGP
jgi:hypothetical protein